MDLCPCGYYGDPIKPCSCAPSAVTKYQKRIPGPLQDRIDIHVEVPRVDYQKLSDDRLGEASEVIRCSEEAARERFADGQTAKRPSPKMDALNVVCIADMRVGAVRPFCKLDAAGESLVRGRWGN